MNISQNTGIENALTYSVNSLVNRDFPVRLGPDEPAPEAFPVSQPATPEPEEAAPLPKLGRYINVWA